MDVTLAYDRAGNVGTLKWKANPLVGEAGEVPRLRQRRKGLHRFRPEVPEHRGGEHQGDGGLEPLDPANFIAETTATEMTVLGGRSGPPAANKTYYRVVAVDRQGKRSGPSDYAAAPHPVIFSQPEPAARASAPSTATKFVPLGPWAISARGWWTASRSAATSTSRRPSSRWTKGRPG